MLYNNADPVKKIFGKTAKEIFAARENDHSEFHSPNAFCGNAGPEEMKHYFTLVAGLSEEELVKLAITLGFVSNPAEDTYTAEMRPVWENILNEANREDFYREYSKLIKNRKASSKS